MKRKSFWPIGLFLTMFLFMSSLFYQEAAKAYGNPSDSLGLIPHQTQKQKISVQRALKADLVIGSKVNFLRQSAPVGQATAGPSSAGPLTSDDSITAVASMENTGSEGMNFKGNDVWAKFTINGKSYELRAPAGGYYIGPGEHANLSQLLGKFAPGTYSATWEANPQHLAGEIGFDNNKKDCQLVVVTPGALPDLVISSITIEPASGPPSTTFVFKVRTSNQGNAGCSLSELQQVTCWIDDIIANLSAEYVSSATDYYPIAVLVSGFVTNQSAQINFRTKNPLAMGTHTLRCTVDPNNKVVEKNEDNNSKTAQFIVK